METVGVGIDIIQNSRLEKGNQFILKFLSLKEYKIYSALDQQLQLEFVCGRWAAKEAIIKATNKKYMYSEITILDDDLGKPKIFIEDAQTDKILISISHEKKYTIAFAIVVK